MKFGGLSEKEEEIANKIVDIAFTVHQKLSHGQLEKAYNVSW